MAPYLIFFVSCILFILGVLIASVGFSFLVTPIATAIAAILIYRFGFRFLALISIFIAIGSFYYMLDDYRYKQNWRAIENGAPILGIVATNPERDLTSQTFYLKAADSAIKWKVLIKINLNHEYFYGDKLLVSGKMKKPTDDYYGKYLAKEKIHGTMLNPKIELVSSGNGSKILAALFGAKNKIKDSYQKLLPREPAAFLSGITLSDNGDSSDEFLKKLSLSGTRHLTAVSGLHIMIVTAIVWFALIYILPRRLAFFLTFLLIGSFVAMTGFKASAVRAAIMGFVAFSGKEMIKRPHAAHNAVALSALTMILWNPKILVFDVGFQLSFLAAISIIYFMPVLKNLINLGKEKGFLNWKELLLVTISAQLATAPILIAQFQNFSITSFAANVLVLPAIPIIMALGFSMGLSGLIFYPLAYLISFAIYPLLNYIIFVINLLASLSVVINPRLGAVGMAMYYIFLILAVYSFYAGRKKIIIEPNS